MSENSTTEEREKKLLRENLELRSKLQESEEILEAIRSGAVDALTVQGPSGPQIFTIKGADHTYRVLIEEMSEGALTLNGEAIILYSNYRFSDFINQPLESIIGTSFYDFLLPEDQDRFRRLFKQGWEKSSKGEFALRAHQGKVLPFSISMNALSEIDTAALGMIVTDLSAEKEILAIKSQVAVQNEIISRKEEELLKEKQTKEEAERFRLVLEGIPQIAWTSTPEGEINYTNQFWYEYTSLSQENTVGDGWQEALHPADRARTAHHFQHCLNTGEGVNIENRFKRASDNTYRWHITRAQPVRNAQQQIILWVGTCTDIQDQKEYTEKIAQAREDLSDLNVELNTKNAQLIRTNNDLDTFVYTASHDLKSPILNIEGLIRLLKSKLQREGMLEDDKQKLINMISHSIDRFKFTIQDLTEIAKVQKSFEEDTTLVNFDEIITDVKDSIQEMINNANAAIYCDTTEQPDINISRKNLKSIIYNFLSNSIKYRSPDRTPEIYLKTEKIAGQILLSIRDNGLGMDLRKSDKIFVMFKRLHNHVEGTGVGLYIVKRIIDNMGGRIEVESTPGHGTLFKVFFKND